MVCFFFSDNNRYDSRLKGVVLAYKEVKLLESLGTMMPGSGSTTIRFPAQAKLLLYKPTVGSLVGEENCFVVVVV